MLPALPATQPGWLKCLHRALPGQGGGCLWCSTPEWQPMECCCYRIAAHGHKRLKRANILSVNVPKTWYALRGAVQLLC